MARNLKSRNGSGSNQVSEKPFFDRLVMLNREIDELREHIKDVCTEAKEADIPIGPLKLAVKRYLETEEERSARKGKEAEAERILRALGEFVNTPLGEAAVHAAQTDEDSQTPEPMF